MGAEPTTDSVTGSAPSPRRAGVSVAVIGNPNVGKTTLFNRLAGARHKTANFPGTTQDATVGSLLGSDHRLIDLPGAYGLDLSQPESEICRAVLEGRLAPRGEDARRPDVVVVVCDATNMRRSLTLVGEVQRLGLPVSVLVNMIDITRRRGIHIDRDALAERLGCPVALVCARTGEGFEGVQGVIGGAVAPSEAPPSDRDGLEAWAEGLYSAVTGAPTPAGPDRLTDRLDRAFTHPLLGALVFVGVFTGLFWVIFTLATFPMDWIDGVFARLGGLVERVTPPGALREMLVDGAVAGVGATVIFIPQIFLLFLLLSLLEGSGYLARAAFVVDRLLRPFGLSGHAFVPLLSGHACALPAIMSARSIPDRRNQLATILAIPFMSCSARVPVYVLLTTLLFPGRPGMQAVAFTGCYVLGVLAGLLTSLVARGTILRGPGRAMALELPGYRLPDVRLALATAFGKSWLFLRKAGVVILGISVALWWLGAYPQSDPPARAIELRAQAEAALPGDAEALMIEADRAEARHASRASALGRVGAAVQPVFEPLGFDRQLTVGVLASFAAREVFVSTMAVQVVGSDDEGVFESLAGAERDDGRPVFTPATSWSLLVFYVLAMQCLPTLVVTARESGSWKWAGLQLAWMSSVAYAGALVIYQLLSLIGAG